VLPVLVHGDLQVETVIVDLGTGPREWTEVREGDQVEYCADLAERLRMLHRRGLRYADLVAVDRIDDGCE
jgi:hypothetical protein